MEKKNRTTKKVQTDDASHESKDAVTPKETMQANKDVKITSTPIRKFFAEYRLWLSKHKFEVLSGFLVAVAAVYIAFYLAAWSEQKIIDKTTQNRLKLAYMENLYNGIAAKEILDTYADANSLGINVNRPNSIAALAVFQDSNVLQFLPIHKVSLLISYVDSVNTLNQSLLVHLRILETQKYRMTTQEKEARQNVYKNAAAMFAMSFVLREELKEFYDEQSPDWENIKRIENRIKFVKEKALKGEVTLSEGLKGSK